MRVRQPVMEIPARSGVRTDLPRRRTADLLPPSLLKQDFGIVVMSHRGSSNGRLSVLLSSIPENYSIIVSSDSIEPDDVGLDRDVSLYHGAKFEHCSPWGGRARNALHCMEKAPWRLTLFLCDDVWLFGETVAEMLRWYSLIESAEVPIGMLGAPGRETYHDYKEMGFETWGQCLAEPWRFERLPFVPGFMRMPALFKNPFGACMLINRGAYMGLGGFAPNYWAHDDVFNHKIWLSNEWVNCAYPGRGYVHLGAQSWHHGESVEYVGTFDQATGMSAEDSGKLQVASIYRWIDKIGHVFERLGGQAAV